VYFVLCFYYLEKHFCTQLFSIVIDDSSFIFHSVVDVKCILLIAREDKMELCFHITSNDAGQSNLEEKEHRRGEKKRLSHTVQRRWEFGGVSLPKKKTHTSK